MSKVKKVELLDKLQKQKDSINARIASLEARIRKDEDRILTRKKILVGAYMLHKYEQKGEVSKLVKELDAYLKRPNDRKLFGLPVHSESDEA